MVMYSLCVEVVCIGQDAAVDDLTSHYFLQTDLYKTNLAYHTISFLLIKFTVINLFYKISYFPIQQQQQQQQQACSELRLLIANNQ